MPLTTYEAPSDTGLRDAVLAELAEFRRRDGIDVRKIRESGANVMRLPAVERSAADRGVPPDIAAFEYLKCIAGRSRDLGKEYQKIVWATLNFDGDPSSLTQRRDALRGFRKESAFLEYEKAAFENYAGQLVWRRSSPCEDSTTEVDNIAWANALLAMSYDEDANALLTLALARLQKSRTEDEAREEAHRRLGVLPIGLSWLGVTDHADIDEILDASNRLLLGAEAYAKLRGLILHSQEVDRELAERLGVTLTGLRAKYEREKVPMVARTAIWLEQSMSWEDVFRREHRGSRIPVPSL